MIKGFSTQNRPVWQEMSKKLDTTDNYPRATDGALEKKRIEVWEKADFRN
jgi:hypothetical protein